MGFGKSKSKSVQQSQSTQTSFNQAYPFMQSALGGSVGAVGESQNAIRSLLGLAGDTGQRAAFDKFRESSGYNFMRDEGIKSIGASSAAKGLLGSGSALKAITNFSSGLASQYLDKYMSQLTGLGNSGLSAAQIIAGVGQKSEGQATSSGNSKSSSMNVSFG